MINLPIQIEIPKLWGEKKFSKDEWVPINYLVGPNGTGKSIFSDTLKSQLIGFNVRLLNAERLSGFEKRGYSYFGGGSLDAGYNFNNFDTFKSQARDFGLSSDAFVILKEKINLRLRIESFLSDIFMKNISLVESGGFLIPKIQDLRKNIVYGLKQEECHGLKELITLLTVLYDDSYNTLILDEPELHLHPQFQSFFVNEIRKLAGDPRTDPSKKLFFIITHSPYFLDLRILEDLKSVLVFHYDKPPSYINELTDHEKYVLNRFIPRFNTYHKQFFFSPNPVFVEGYRDQQIITLLYDKLDINIGSSGSCVIDVGGKDDEGIFFSICKKLELDARVISDLDAVFSGRMRESFEADDRCNGYVTENGLGENISSLIGSLESKLSRIEAFINENDSTNLLILELKNRLSGLTDIDKKRLNILLFLIHHKDDLANYVSAELKPVVDDCKGKYDQIKLSLEESNVFILNGQIENYYKQSTVDLYEINNKDELFQNEREFILNNNKETLGTTYQELIDILRKCIPLIAVNVKKHIQVELIKWIYIIQSEVENGYISSLDEIKVNANANYSLYNQILDILEFRIEPDRKFLCKIRIDTKLLKNSPVIEFNEKTVAYDFRIPAEA